VRERFSGVAVLLHDRAFPYVVSQFKRKRYVGKQIRESKTVLQKISDGISDPLILLDRDFSIKMLLNRAAAKYYGVHDPQAVIGKRCYEALRERREPCERCPYPLVISNGSDHKGQAHGEATHSQPKVVLPWSSCVWRRP
jgi:PAS domain-containing protein